MSTRIVLEADDDGHVRRYEVLYPGDADIWEIAEFLHRGLFGLGYSHEVIARVLTVDDEESLRGLSTIEPNRTSLANDAGVEE